MDDVSLMPQIALNDQNQSPYRAHVAEETPRRETSPRGRPRFNKKDWLGRALPEGRDPMLDARAIRPSSAPPGPSVFAQQYSQMMGAPEPAAPTVLPAPTLAEANTGETGTVIDLEPSAPPAEPQTIPLSNASASSIQSSEGVSLHRDHLDFITHTNDRFEMILQTISNMSTDYKSLEATSLQLMGTAQRHDKEIADLTQRHTFLSMTDQHFTSGVKDKIDLLEYKIAQQQQANHDHVRQTTSASKLPEGPVMAEAQPLRHGSGAESSTVAFEDAKGSFYRL